MTMSFARSTCSASSSPKSVSPSSKFHHRVFGIPRKVRFCGRNVQSRTTGAAVMAPGSGPVPGEKEYQSRWPPRNSGASSATSFAPTENP